MQRFILSVLLLVFSVVAYGQVYKWVDQNGNTQYTDQPPPSGAAKDERKLNIKTSLPSPSNSDTSSTRHINEEMQAFRERRISKQEEESKLQAQAEENNQKCIDAQGRLKVFRDSPRLRLPDGKGDVVYVDDDMRERTILEAQKNIATYCK
ncbi:MAG: DUF4124 domain-containing protein [Nitrosomonas sp.]|nr:DUF4124 domain-containing protein [Nitrosomonas sp.]MDP1951834.1 DUF4124 domain-containing protein [Nitrosomonas sp.]